MRGPLLSENLTVVPGHGKTQGLVSDFYPDRMSCCVGVDTAFVVHSWGLGENRILKKQRNLRQLVFWLQPKEAGSGVSPEGCEILTGSSERHGTLVHFSFCNEIPQAGCSIKKSHLCGSQFWRFKCLVAGFGKHPLESVTL